jgi:hypothetical protein
MASSISPRPTMPEIEVFQRGTIYRIQPHIVNNRGCLTTLWHIAECGCPSHRLNRPAFTRTRGVPLDRLS